MSDWTSLAFFELTGWWHKPAAILVGFVVGALLTGLGVQGITHMFTGQKVPGFFLNIVRSLGGVMGFLIVLWGMGGPGGGWGNGPGLGAGKGPGDGSGTSKYDKSTVMSPTTDKSKEKESEKEKEKSDRSLVLRIEVLGPDPLKALGLGNEPDRCYRVNLPKGAKVLTLNELKKFINPSGNDPKWKHLKVVIYMDSPAPIYSRVPDLKDWATKQLMPDPKEKFQVDEERVEANAPVN
jgi:hypothetical protein